PDGEFVLHFHPPENPYGRFHADVGEAHRKLAADDDRVAAFVNFCAALENTRVAAHGEAGPDAMHVARVLPGTVDLDRDGWKFFDVELIAEVTVAHPDSGFQAGSVEVDAGTH